MVVKIYVETSTDKWELLDLYDDESINLTFKLKDMADISKVFSPYTQDFTIPASNNNNRALNHFFKTEVVRTRNRAIPCRIEVNGQLFKIGTLQIVEGAKSNFKLRNYKCKFSTSVSQIKEKIGEDTISKIVGEDLNDESMSWTDSSVYDRIVNGVVGDDMLVPLISTHRTWSYGTGATDDVSNPDNAITKEELKPVIKVEKVLRKLIDMYGFKVESPLFNRSEFTRLYMWLNSKVENTTIKTDLEVSKNFILQNGHSNQFFTPTPFNGNIRIVDTGDSYSTNRNYTVNVYLLNVLDGYSNSTYTKGSTLKVQELGTDLVQTVEGIKFINSIKYSFQVPQEQIGKIRDFKLSVEFEDLVTFNDFTLDIYTTGSSPDKNFYMSILNPGFNPTIKLNVQQALGEYKVIDFFSSIFKMFNIRVVEDDITGIMYWLTPEDFKATGQRKDLNKYVDVKDYVLQPSTNYKTFTFKHNKAPYYRNVVYAETVGKEYGSEIYDSLNQNLTENYTLETKLNVLNYFKVNGTSNLLTSYGFDEKQSPVIANEPTFMYAEGAQIIRNDEDTMNVNIRFKTPVINNPNGTNQLARYVKFSNRNGTYDNYTNSLTFDIDIDPITLRSMTKSLYYNYYKDEIDRLYYSNSNYFTFEGYLNKTAVSNFNMADELIIEDRVFTIEEANLDITTGKVKLKLLNLVDKFGVDEQPNVGNIPEIFEFNATGGWVKMNGIITGSYDPVYPIRNFEIEYQKKGTTTWTMFTWGYTPMTSQVWNKNNVSAGTYTVRARAVNTLGNKSNWATVENVVVQGLIALPVEIDDIIVVDPCKTFPPVKGQIGIKDAYLPVKNIRDFKIGEQIYLDSSMITPYTIPVERRIQIGSVEGDFVLDAIVTPNGRVKDILPCGFKVIRAELLEQPVATVSGACTLFDSSIPKTKVFTAGGFKLNTSLYKDEDLLQPLELESESYYGVRIEGETQFRAVKLDKSGQVMELATLCGELPPIEVKTLSIDTRSVSNTPYSSCSKFIDPNLNAYVENFEVGATLYQDVDLDNPLTSFEGQYVSLADPDGYLANIRMSADSTIEEIIYCQDVTPTLILQASDPQESIQDSCNLINEYPNILYAKSFSEGSFLYENPELTVVSEFGEDSLLGISFQGKRYNILKQDGKITNLTDCSVFNKISFVEISDVNTVFEAGPDACENSISLIGMLNQKIYYRGSSLEDNTEMFYDAGLLEPVIFSNGGYLPMYDKVRGLTGTLTVSSGESIISTYNYC